MFFSPTLPLKIGPYGKERIHILQERMGSISTANVRTLLVGNL